MKRTTKFLNSIPRGGQVQAHRSASNISVFSGIQPTGVPHLGNYLGALRQWVGIQDNSPKSARLTFCIVDLHAITQPQEAEQLRKHKTELMATLLAVGLDPRKCTVFEQSRVPAHSELMWILSCVAPMARLNRMTQWKSKLGVSSDQDSFMEKATTAGLKLGLFSYPVLQAADILIHKTTHVPVGEDQAQHLELTREIASSFNKTYKKDILKLPITLLSPAKRVMSLKDPTQKMSKSAADPASRILLTDSPKEVHDKLRKAVTDSVQGPLTYDMQNRPGLSNLIEILAHIRRRQDFGNVAKEFEDLSLKAFKDLVADAISEHLEPIRDEYEKIIKESNREVLRFVASEGERKARESAEETLAEVKEVVGI
ncbi:tryptophanyl-tRNA synthetase [Choiromyces venosus 120613-1]|uniref:Tryptophan--tRNA ligase, mitochondrial n=1 Tax=Choiromyces venosus 120613-1 TaxID=1336337 RepID=A0A3N4J1F4_9PEZI|nr:tryptophanyl-tRNA synthetase [Choiromyces venosus 120613-1]